MLFVIVVCSILLFVVESLCDIQKSSNQGTNWVADGTNFTAVKKLVGLQTKL